LKDIAAEELVRTAERVIGERMAEALKLPPDLPEPTTLRNFTDYGVMVSYAPPPPRNVIEKLERLDIQMRDIRVESSVGFFPVGLKRRIGVRMRVPLLRREEHPFAPREIDLYGGYATASGTDEEIVATARRLLIDLVTHEIDEALFVAGLGPDPHAPKTLVFENV
jgi:hypothetical protein